MKFTLHRNDGVELLDGVSSGEIMRELARIGIGTRSERMATIRRAIDAPGHAVMAYYPTGDKRRLYVSVIPLQATALNGFRPWQPQKALAETFQFSPLIHTVFNRHKTTPSGVHY